MPRFLDTKVLLFTSPVINLVCIVGGFYFSSGGSRWQIGCGWFHCGMVRAMPNDRSEVWGTRTMVLVLAYLSPSQKNVVHLHLQLRVKTVWNLFEKVFINLVIVVPGLATPQSHIIKLLFPNSKILFIHWGGWYVMRQLLLLSVTRCLMQRCLCSIGKPALYVYSHLLRVIITFKNSLGCRSTVRCTRLVWA